jgi:cytochrome c2
MIDRYQTIKTWRLWLSVVGAVCLGLLLAYPVMQAGARPYQQDAQEGAQLFGQYCQACHTIGMGDTVGPDLQGVTQRRDQAWLLAFITQPDQVLASGDVIANDLLKQYAIPMPNLGITDAQALSILAYLENPDATQVQAAPVLTGGQAAQGQRLFSGQAPLTNGGTACIACHSTAGVGLAGGGVLGPDLTNVYGRMGDVGLTSSLSTLPFPSMQGIFNTRPLTAQEQADLFAYFQQTDQQQVVTSALNNNLVWAAGSIGALILFSVMMIFWPRQRESISDRLRKAA